MKRPTAVIVEDNRTMLRSLRILLEGSRFNFRTVLCESFDSFNKLCHKHEERPQLVVSDFRLGGAGNVNGLEVGKLAKRFFPHAARVLCSGAAGPEIQVKAYQTDDFDEVIEKGEKTTEDFLFSLEKLCAKGKMFWAPNVSIVGLGRIGVPTLHLLANMSIKSPWIGNIYAHTDYVRGNYDLFRRDLDALGGRVSFRSLEEMFDSSEYPDVVVVTTGEHFVDFQANRDAFYDNSSGKVFRVFDAAERNNSEVFYIVETNPMGRIINEALMKYPSLKNNLDRITSLTLDGLRIKSVLSDECAMKGNHIPARNIHIDIYGSHGHLEPDFSSAKVNVVDPESQICQEILELLDEKHSSEMNSLAPLSTELPEIMDESFQKRIIARAENFAVDSQIASRESGFGNSCLANAIIGAIGDIAHFRKYPSQDNNTTWHAYDENRGFYQCPVRLDYQRGLRVIPRERLTDDLLD